MALSDSSGKVRYGIDQLEKIMRDYYEDLYKEEQVMPGVVPQAKLKEWDRRLDYWIEEDKRPRIRKKWLIAVEKDGGCRKPCLELYRDAFQMERLMELQVMNRDNESNMNKITEGYFKPKHYTKKIGKDSTGAVTPKLYHQQATIRVPTSDRIGRNPPLDCPKLISSWFLSQHLNLYTVVVGFRPAPVAGDDVDEWESSVYRRPVWLQQPDASHSEAESQAEEGSEEEETDRGMSSASPPASQPARGSLDSEGEDVMNNPILNPHINHIGGILATSSSKEILRLLRYISINNTPQQAQSRQRAVLPPAKLIPDPNIPGNQPPNVNFPVISLPQNQVFPIDMNYLSTLLGILSTMQTLPMVGGGMTVPQQLTPGQAMLPIIVTQMGPQGAVLSSEEMSPSQFFTGLLVPGMQGAMFPSGQAEPPPEGQDGFLPVGQANPEGTAAGIQKVFPTDGLTEFPGELYPTPSGFRQPDAGTSGMFVEPTADINMEPNELREPPTSVKFEMGNMQSPQNLSQSLVRGDSPIPMNTVAGRPLNVP
ncbi:amelotin [Erythrolamprus reginae]|uniref:amelotin n=1 Tax=Erythrolamprus reginae TaxID=121349 RepID=UPI00396CB2C0